MIWRYQQCAVFFPNNELGSTTAFATTTPIIGSGSGSATDPVELDDNDDDSNSELPVTPTPNRHCPRHRQYPRPRETRSSSPAAAAASGSGSRSRSAFRRRNEDDVVVVATAAAAVAATPNRRPLSGSGAIDITGATPAVFNPRGSGNRSTSRTRRATAIANPVTNERIIVGTWIDANGNATTNAVAAGFDAYGRFQYRIIAQDLNGRYIAAPTATATNFNRITLRPAYARMDHNTLRLVCDQHLRLPRNQRP